MENERLIEEVRKYPVLYDIKNERYRNSEYKEKIWKQIASNINAKGGIDGCKRRWSQMRDQLRKTLKKRMSTSGQSSIQRKYKYEDELSFLIPHMAEKPFSFKDDNEYLIDDQDSTDAMRDEDEDFDNEIANDKEFDFKTEIPEKQTGDVTLAKPSNLTSLNFLPLRNGMRKDRTIRPRIMKRKLPAAHIRPPVSAASQLMSFILEEKEAERKAKKQLAQKDSVDAFLDGIAPSLKALNPILLNQAKSRIFAIVQEFEMKQLMGDQQSYFESHGTSSIPTSSPTGSPLAEGFQINDSELSFQPPLNVIPKTEFDITPEDFH